MSESGLWETVNKALSPDQRKELNTIISSLRCMASVLFVASEGEECRERNIGMGLKLLTDQIPYLSETGADSSSAPSIPEADYKPTEPELNAFRHEVLCDLREVQISYEDCAIQLGMTAEGAELAYTSIVDARYKELGDSHPFGYSEPTLEDLVIRCPFGKRADRIDATSKLKLMWPFTEWPYPYDAATEANHLVGEVLSALTRQLPHHERESILKRRRQRLFQSLRRFPQHDNCSNSSLTPDQRELAIRKSEGLRGRRPARRGRKPEAVHSSKDPSND